MVRASLPVGNVTWWYGCAVCSVRTALIELPPNEGRMSGESLKQIGRGYAQPRCPARFRP